MWEFGQEMSVGAEREAQLLMKLLQNRSLMKIDEGFSEYFIHLSHVCSVRPV